MPLLISIGGYALLKDRVCSVCSLNSTHVAVKSNANPSIHKSAFQIEFTRRFSVFAKVIEEKKKGEKSVYEKAFHSAYSLMNSFISNRQFIPFAEFHPECL